MSAITSIEWTDRTWNPVRGCSRITEGCRNCYAELIAARFSGTGQAFDGFAERSPARWTGRVSLIESALSEPLSWRKPARVFVNSMSDLFHNDLGAGGPDAYDAVDRIFAVMALAPHLTFQVLTKRPGPMRRWFSPIGGVTRGDFVRHQMFRIRDTMDSRKLPPYVWPLPNVWLGVSVEDQATADVRIPLLLQTPAAVRFVSYEPALGPVDLGLDCIEKEDGWEPPFIYHDRTALHPCDYACDHVEVLGGLDWVIVGGESGPGARPFNIEWARAAVRQCKEAGVAVFVKQLGANVECIDVIDAADHFPGPVRLSEAPRPNARVHLQSAKGGDPAEWPEDLRVREFPAVPV